MSIPVVAVVDSNSDPDGIAYPVPGNDDASRAINLYCDLMVGAVLDGLQAEMVASGADVGAFEEPPEELESAGAGAGGHEGRLRPSGPADGDRSRAAEPAAGAGSPRRAREQEPRDTASARLSCPGRIGSRPRGEARGACINQVRCRTHG